MLLKRGHVDLEVTDATDVLLERFYYDLGLTDATDMLLSYGRYGRAFRERSC